MAQRIHCKFVDRDGNELIIMQRPDHVMPSTFVGVGITEDDDVVLYFLVHRDVKQMTPRDEWVPGARMPR